MDTNNPDQDTNPLQVLLLAKMSFDEILDLTAGVFSFLECCILSEYTMYLLRSNKYSVAESVGMRSMTDALKLSNS